MAVAAQLPPLLPATVQRYYVSGMPTPDQVRYETALRQYLQYVGTYLPPMGSNLPTADPHKVGAVWRNSGVLTVSAG